MPIPIIPIITAAASLISSASKASKAKKAEREAELSLNSIPKYQPNQSILDYYDKALQKYNTSPTDTTQYKADKQNIKQSTVQGLSSLNKLRSGNVANILQVQNNSLLRAALNAENKKAQEFATLGGATRMKAGEESKAFQQNEVVPFEAKYNLLTTKAAGYRAAQRQEAQNGYNNASSLLASNFGNMDDWGDGVDRWGRAIKTVGGKDFTRGKYNRLNNIWGGNRNNYAAY